MQKCIIFRYSPVVNNWDDFRFFSALKKTGTLRSAARSLGTDQATVGRRISALEQKLGVKLFEKRSDGYFVTSAGERIGGSIERVEFELESVHRNVAGDDQRLEGLVRIAAPGALANHLLIPGLKAFLAKHPKITLQFLTGPDVVNLAKREADIALRLVRPNQRDLHVRRMGSLTLGLYGDKELLKARGRPSKLEDLGRIPFIGLHPDAVSAIEEKLLESMKPYLRYSLISHAWTSVFAGVRVGEGIGIVPTFMGDRETTLERLRVVAPISAPIWLVIHPDLKTNARIKVLIEELDALCGDPRL